MRAILAVNLLVIFVQFVFSGDPRVANCIFVARFRLMIISSLIEKLTYVGITEGGAPGCGDRQRLRNYLGQIYRSSESAAVTTASDEVRSGVR